MNRHLKVSLTLTALSLTTIGLLTSCNSSTDLEAKINANQVELKTELSAAIQKAETDLNAAKTQLQGLIAAGDTANSQALSEAIASLTNAIETAKTTLSENCIDESELTAAINAAKAVVAEGAAANLELAKEEFTQLVGQQEQHFAGQITSAQNDLNAAIEAAMEVARNSDASLREDLEAAIVAVKEECVAAVSDTIDAKAEEIAKMVEDRQNALDAELKQTLDSLQDAINAGNALAEELSEATKNELTASINAARQEATDNLAMSVALLSEELSAKIEAGDKASTAEVQAMLDEMNAVIEASKALAAENDALLKDELGIQIAVVKADLQDEITKAVKDASDELKALLAEHEAANAEELKAFYDSFAEMVAAAELMMDAKDAAISAELKAELAVAKTEILAAVDSAKAEMAAELAAYGEELMATFEDKLQNSGFASREEMISMAEALTAAITEAKEYALSSDEALKSTVLSEVYALFGEHSDALKAATDKLYADIKAEMDAGFVKTADDLAKVTSDFGAMLTALEQTVATGDANVKAELMATLEAAKLEATTLVAAAIDSAVAELTAKIEAGDAKTREDLVAAFTEMQELIAIAQSAAETDNALLKAELETKIDGIEVTLRQVIDDAIANAVENLEAKLDSQATASEAAIKDAYDELKALIDAVSATVAEGDAATQAVLEAALANAKAEVLDAIDGKLATLKDELQAAIDASSSEAAAKAEELAGMINATNSAFAEADEALRVELDGMVNAAKEDVLAFLTATLKAEKDALLAKVEEGDKANADALIKAKLELEENITNIKIMYEALKKQDDQFHQKFDALHNEIKASLAAVSDASMKLADWNITTDKLVDAEGGLDRLKEIYASYEAKKDTYIDDDFAQVEELYVDSLVRLIRATTIADVEQILADFAADASEVRTWQDRIYDALMAVGKDATEIEYDADGEGLLLVNKLLTDARAAGLDEAYITGYPVDGSVVDLQALYNEYYATYVALGQLSDGAKIKEDMDAIVGPIMWNDVELYNKVEQLLDIYKGWASIEGNNIANVEGFEETLAKVQAMYDRYWKLDKAKTYAGEINEKIAKAMADVEKTGATWANEFNVNSILAEVDAWVAMFFEGEYASEIGNSANYELLAHGEATKLVEAFDAKVAEFKAEAEAFKNAVLGIGDVNLLSWDEINAALTQYGNFVLSRDLNDFTYLFDEGETPAKYYEMLVTKYGEYRTLKATAYNDYVVAFAEVDGISVGLYDGAKVDAMLAWYASYGVVDADGNIVFDNGAAGAGYVLSGALTVTEADYNEIVAMKADYLALRAAKLAEVEDLYNRIDAVAYNVTYGQRDVISALRAAYNAYLSGASVLEGYTAEQYAINMDLHVGGAFAEYEVANAESLELAEEILADLVKQVKVIKNFINAGKPYTGYSDFVDAADRDSFDKYVAVVEGALDKFFMDNGYSYEDAFTPEELAKVYTSRLAVQKYDATVELMKYTPGFLELVLEMKLPEADKDVLASAVYGVYTDSAASIDAATNGDDVASIKALAYDKFAAIKTAAQIYDEYLAVFTFDETLDQDTRAEIALKMSLSFETTVNRIVVSANKADVEQNVKFVADELESLYSIKGLE